MIKFAKLPIHTGNEDVKDFTWINPLHVIRVCTHTQPNLCWVVTTSIDVEDGGSYQLEIELSPKKAVAELQYI